MRAQVLSICSSAASTSARLKPCRSHAAVEMLADRPDVGLLGAKALLVEPGVARQEAHVERGHPHRHGRHLLEDSASRRASWRAATASAGVRRGAGYFSSRYSQMTLESTIDVAVVHQRRHDAVRVELEILRLELVLALAEVEPDVLERQALFGQADANLLAAGGVGGVVQLQHGRSTGFSHCMGPVRLPRRRAVDTYGATCPTSPAITSPPRFPIRTAPRISGMPMR